MGPEDLNKALADLPLTTHPNLIVGLERVEDAGVYKLNEEQAIVQTLDFFTPIVDDPYTFGQIAATNSLSDIYAMGAKPLTAMNIVCFPIGKLDISVLKEVLRGGLDKIREAEVVLVGGHSVDDQEIKYGLSVTGVIHPVNVMRKEDVQVGDKLVLTKRLGTGIISTAIKGGMASEEATEEIIKSMTTLNRKASEVMQEVGVNACTDVTGFGLIGHAAEMIEKTKKGIVIKAGSVPVFGEAVEMAEMGMVPAGLYRNRDYRKAVTEIDPAINEFLADILFDPQTSGGLLISVKAEKVGILLEKLHTAGVTTAAVIGEVTAQPGGRIVVVP